MLQILVRWNIREKTADLSPALQVRQLGSEATGPGQEHTTRLDQTLGLLTPSPVLFSNPTLLLFTKCSHGED